MESFESAGLSWLPESPDTQEVGIVTYSDDEGFIRPAPLGFLGKMGPRSAGFADDVQRAQELLGTETDSTFRELWE
jgi:hypothetical protein